VVEDVGMYLDLQELSESPNIYGGPFEKERILVAFIISEKGS
jgi:hypothetical protein